MSGTDQASRAPIGFSTAHLGRIRFGRGVVAAAPAQPEILLVEHDSPGTDKTLRALRENTLLGSLWVVRDGEEALQFLFRTGRYSDRGAAQDPHLILLALDIPKVDGTEVLTRLKADPRLRLIPVVVLVSSPDEALAVEAAALDVRGYLVTSADFPRFCEAVGALRAFCGHREAPRRERSATVGPCSPA